MGFTRCIFTALLGLSLGWLCGCNGQGVDAPVILHQPQSLEAPKGQSATFAVEAKGNGSLAFQWHKDGEPLPQAQGPELTLQELKASDEGIYSVRITNNRHGESASLESEKAKLKVLEKISPEDVP